MKHDAQLIHETLAGSSDAFGQLVLKYQDRLFSSLVHITRCREEAEDVAQEAFVQAFWKLDSFHGKSSFYTWLYRIAHNRFVSRNRRIRPEVSVEAAREAAGIEVVDPSEAPHQALQRCERAEQVHVALGELNEQYRTILVLREMEDRCYEDIADILDLPVGTVRSRLHRARMHLRDKLKGAVHES